MTESKLYNRLEQNLFTRGYFKLYTIPNCTECEKVKEFLEKNKIPYCEINAEPYTEGRKEVNDIYTYSENGGGKKKIKKDEDGAIIFPILIWENLSQGKEISELFKSLNYLE